MKLLAKVAIVTIIGGIGATMYAAPGGGGGDELLVRGVTLQTRMKGELGAIEQLQAKARREHDVIKLNCVNDKLIVAKPLMNISDHLVVEIEAARDRASSEAAVASLTSNMDQMQRLHEAASQCVDSKVLAHESSNSYTHPDVPGISSTNPTWEGTGEIEPPAYASPDH